MILTLYRALVSISDLPSLRDFIKFFKMFINIFTNFIQ